MTTNLMMILTSCGAFATSRTTTASWFAATPVRSGITENVLMLQKRWGSWWKQKVGSGFVCIARYAVFLLVFLSTYDTVCLQDASLKRPAAAARRVRKASRASSDSSASAPLSSSQSSQGPVSSTEPSTPSECIVCKRPSRTSSIYCSDACIRKHAKSFEKVSHFHWIDHFNPLCGFRSSCLRRPLQHCCLETTLPLPPI